MPQPDLNDRLPLLLCQLLGRNQELDPYRRLTMALNLWEASIELLAIYGIAVCETYRIEDDALAKAYRQLARPSLGHWLGIVGLTRRCLTAQNQDFNQLSHLLEETTATVPSGRFADETICRWLNTDSQAQRSGFRWQLLLENIVTLRNRMAHGAPAMRNDEDTRRLADHLFQAAGSFLGQVQVFHAWRMVYVAEVAKHTASQWRIEYTILQGNLESRQRTNLFDSRDIEYLPVPSRTYLVRNSSIPKVAWRGRAGELDPLVFYESRADRLYLLNGSRNQRSCQLLSYATDDRIQFDLAGDLEASQREFISRLLGVDVSPADVAHWRGSPDSMMPQSDPAGEAASAGDEPADVIESSSGERWIGSFRLKKLIGCGGTARVYRARQEGWDSDVAIKCISFSADDTILQRFNLEIATLSRIEHPSVVRIITSGFATDEAYYVMNLIEGPDLARVWGWLSSSEDSGTLRGSDWDDAVENARRQRIDESSGSSMGSHGSTIQKMKTAEAVRSYEISQDVGRRVDRTYIDRIVDLLISIADGLHAIHETGVIHRDVKPSNLMIDKDGTPVLIDPGLACLDDRSKRNITRSQDFIGTIRYASPEHCNRKLSVDRRSDIYSLGVTAYELLTLRSVFDRDADPAEIFNAIAETVPVRVAKHNPAIPSDLEAIVMRCLEKRRDLRYQSSQHLAEDLRRFRNGDPVRAIKLTPAYALRKYAAKHWKQCAAGIIGFFAILSIGFVLAAIFYESMVTARQQEKRARIERYVSDIRLAGTMLNSGDRFAAQGLLKNYDLGSDFADDLRGPEWHFLWHEATAISNQLLQHDDVVRRLAFNLDHRLLASVGLDGRVQLVNVDDPEVVFQRFVSAGLYAVAISDDGTMLAAAGDDARILVWHTDDLKQTDGPSPEVLLGHESTITNLAYRTDGSLLSVSDDKTIRLWALEANGQQLHPKSEIVDRFSGRVLCLASADTQFAASDELGVIKIFDMASNQSVLKIELTGSLALSICFNREGTVLYAAGGDSDRKPVFAAWDVRSGKPIYRKEDLDERVYSVAIGPDESSALLGLANGRVQIRDRNNGALINQWAAHDRRANAIVIDPMTRRVFTGGGDNNVKVWKYSDSSTLGVDDAVIADDSISSLAPRQGLLVRQFDTPVTIVTSDSTRTRVAVVADKIVCEYQTTVDGSESLLQEYQFDHSVSAIAYHPQKPQLAIATISESANATEETFSQVFATVPGSNVASLRFVVPRQRILTVCYSAEGDQLATSDENGDLTVWSLNEGNQVNKIATLSGRQAEMILLSGRIDRVGDQEWAWFDDESKTAAEAEKFAMVGVAGDLRIWSVDDSVNFIAVMPIKRLLTSLAYDPVGHCLASGSMDGVVRLCRSGEPTTIDLRGHKDIVLDVDFTSDGRSLLSVGVDGNAIFWNVASGRELCRFQTGVSRSPCLSIGLEEFVKETAARSLIGWFGHRDGTLVRHVFVQ